MKLCCTAAYMMQYPAPRRNLKVAWLLVLAWVMLQYNPWEQPFARGFGGSGDRVLAEKKEKKTVKRTAEAAKILKLAQQEADPQRSCTLWKKSRVAMGKASGKGTPDYARICGNLGAAHLELGELEQASAAYTDALVAFARAVGDKDPQYATCLRNLAHVQRRLGNFSQAEDALKRAMQILGRDLELHCQEYILALRSLVSLYDVMGKPELARPLHLEQQRIQGIANKITGGA